MPRKANTRVLYEYEVAIFNRKKQQLNVYTLRAYSADGAKRQAFARNKHAKYVRVLSRISVKRLKELLKGRGAELDEVMSEIRRRYKEK